MCEVTLRARSTTSRSSSSSCSFASFGGASFISVFAIFADRSPARCRLLRAIWRAVRGSSSDTGAGYRPSMPERQIELFFDIGSSYSYLAATQMERLTSRTGVPVRWRPFLLGAVFKSTGNDMPARIPAKARWMLGDMGLWAKHYGVPFRMPTRFPLITLRTQRALAAAELRDPASVAPFALALFRAYWAEGR